MVHAFSPFHLFLHARNVIRSVMHTHARAVDGRSVWCALVCVCACILVSVMMACVVLAACVCVQVFGIAGRGRRCVLPECVLQAARAEYPNPPGVPYTGFRHGNDVHWSEEEAADAFGISDYGDSEVDVENVAHPASTNDSSGTDSA